MKLLFDENLSFRLCRQLHPFFPDSSQVRLAGLAQADDDTIWRFAGANDYVIVSLDADFAERAAALGPPPKVIWLRCGNKPTESVAALLSDNFELIEAFSRDEAACLEIY